jgi:hypothetical protein
MDILRDAPFGQACRLVRGWHLFQYPEERDPTYIQSCLGNLDEAERREWDGREAVPAFVSGELFTNYTVTRQANQARILHTQAQAWMAP